MISARSSFTLYFKKQVSACFFLLIITLFALFYHGLAPTLISTFFHKKMDINKNAFWCGGFEFGHQKSTNVSHSVRKFNARLSTNPRQFMLFSKMDENKNAFWCGGFEFGHQKSTNVSHSVRKRKCTISHPHQKT